MSEIDRQEAERQEAETEREQHELRRRIAEGGPDNHVPGQSSDVSGRQEAELVREERLRKIYPRIAVLVALPIALISLIPSMVGIYLVDRETDARCIDSQINREAIRVTIARNISTLGYAYNEDSGELVRVGKPIDYYATHPEELADALNNAIKALELFPTISCDDGWL